MFPGDEGDIEVIYRRAGQLYGELKKLTVPSAGSDRSALQSLPCLRRLLFSAIFLSAQLKFKQKTVQEQFRKLGHAEVQPLPTLGMEKPYFYRNKVQMPFA
jgi:tRNA/tmRNA/rRNA uracil-C5-methylase (TrmA/RlmC/RlmD family)